MSPRQPEGFLATPASGKGPGVIVLHPWWGLNETVKEVCRRLAAEGFLAFAPDLFHAKVATTIEGAEALVRAHEEARGKSDIAEAVAFLSQHPARTGASLGAIGFSFGAYYALDLSGEYPDLVRAVVIFYGTGGGDFTRSKAAYLGHFAETDPFEPAADVKSVEDSLHAAGRSAIFHTYPGTGHWFFEPDRSDAYDEGAAKLAWERTLAFLKEALSPGA